VTVLQSNVVPHVHRLGSPFVNWYAVEDGDRLTVVDAGLRRFATGLERDLHELGHRPEDVEAVVLTHSDADHTGVATVLREAGATIYVHGYDQSTLAAPGPKGGDARPWNVLPALRHPQAWRTMLAMVRGGAARPEGIEGVEIVAHGDVLDVPGRPKVIHTPGHTPGHVAVLFEDRGALFVGDALCTWSPLTGRRGPRLMPEPLNVSNAEARESVRRIGALDAEVALPGHGEPWHGPPATLARHVADAA
jgi:glyoxylase-like metal-dependent hydrolase (beta-lactamase superfamily II)